MKLLKTSDELISHMKIKGIKFDIVKEEEGLTSWDLAYRVKIIIT